MDISPTIREAVRGMAQDRFGNAPVFMARSTEASPGVQVQTGDLVVYVRTEPNPGDPVAIEKDNLVGFERWDPGGGKVVKGVVLTVIKVLGR